MIKKIVEAPFHFAGWLFKDTYGRLFSILLLTVLVCLVNYPIQDTEIGVWEVEYTLKEQFSREKSKEEGKKKSGPSYVDATNRIDATAIESRKTFRRVRLDNQWALITMPFHHVAERRVKLISERWNDDRTRKIVRMEVLRISRGLVLGLDLQGGTELTYRIIAPENVTEDITVDANDMAQIVRERIDNSGSKEPRVQVEGRDRLLIQIPGVDASDVARVKSIITRTGRLEFRLVADPKVNEAVLNQARTKDKPPAGWHWYTIEKTDPDDPAKTKEERILVSDSLEPGEGLTGENIKSVSVGRGGQAGSEIAVHVSFKDENEFWTLTKKNVNRRLAIILDDVRDQAGKLAEAGTAFSAPVIRQAILGSAEITGGFTQKEAEELKLVLQSGSLKWPLRPESERFVGPYQGLKSIQDGRQAITIGFIAVVIFILIYYLKAGLIADFALLLNLLILVALLALRSATLTLPGIAGIMLTIGMSIDANVLIFERIREEMKKMADKPLLKCMRDGQSKALVTIFDANLTTLITGVILHEFGSGPIKGFAYTLSWGIVISMFTAVVVTRIIFEALIKLKTLKSLTMLEIIKSPNIPFIATRKIWLTASAVLVVGGLVYFFSGAGERFGIEFRSGTRVEVNLKEKVDAEVVRSKLKAANYEDAQVQEASRGVLADEGSSSFSIRLQYVPVIEVTKSGRVDAAERPEFEGGAQVFVEADREADPKEMEARLADVGSPGCTVELGPKADKLFTFVVRNKDKEQDAINDLEANVRSVFGSELITGDIRRAFRKDDGTSMLADEGVRVLSDTTARIALKTAAKPEDIKKVVAARVPDADVRPVGELRDGKASVVLVATTNAADALPKIKDALRINDIATLEPFGGVTKIYPSVAQELTVKAIVAMGLALLAIVAYIWFRFEFRFGLAAVIALVHDVSITLAFLALFQIEISLTVIAALLTIVGYSLNDTIVIFDRIRENRKTVRKTAFPDIVNLSINQTLSRTLLTGVTTLLAVGALYFLGGAAIRPFAATLLVGIVAGTYSSIFIASPVLLMTGEQNALRGPLGSTSSKTVRPLEGFRATN
ncbi:MAG: protein translocase subunit SecD [Planctomycetota bacterium]